jgi:hypothetical protein
MAIILLCVLQVDNTGWRSTQTQLNNNPYPAAGQVQPAAAAGPWTAEELIDRAGRAIRESVTGGQDTTSSAANWPEIEQALNQPIGQTPASSTAAGDSLRHRIRSAGDVTAQPPQPGSTAPSHRTGDLSGGFPSFAGPPTLPPNESRRADPAFPEQPSALLNQLPSGAARGRETLYEAEPADANSNRRYITPPSRGLVDQDALRQPASPPPQDQTRVLSENGSTLQDLPAPPGSTASQTPANPSTSRSSSRPWGPLLLSVLGLFGSLGFNLYLGWIAWDLYARYQEAVEDVQELEAKLEAKQQEFPAVSRTSRHPAMVSG